MFIRVHSWLKNIGFCVFVVAFAFKISLSLWQVSPVFIDEIVYADIAAEIGYDNNWEMRCPFMFQPFPAFYSATLSPSFLFFKSLGMNAVYKIMLLTNNLISLFGALAILGILKSFLRKNNLKKFFSFSWLIAALVLLWPSFSVYQIVLLSENLFISLYLVSIWLLYKILSQTQNSKITVLSFGIVLAFLYGTRNVNGFLIWPVVILILIFVQNWKSIIFTIVGIIIGLVFVLGPEYLWGAGKICQYSGRENFMIETFEKVISNKDWTLLFLSRVGNSFLYPILATFVIPIAASIVYWKKMPKEWRLSWIYVGLGFLILVPGNVLHTFTETPEKCDLICRYYDPFIMGFVILGLLPLALLKINNLFLKVCIPLSGLMLFMLLRIKFYWWMQTLPITYIRLAKRTNFPMLLMIGILVIVVLFVIIWFLKHRKKGAAFTVGILFLSTITFCNAYHYRQYGLSMKKMNYDAQYFIGKRQFAKIDELSLLLAPGNPDFEELLRLSIYFWTLDRREFIVK